MENKYKVVIVGDKFVGKTSLVNTLKNASFIKTYEPTRLCDVSRLYIGVENKNILVDFFDIAGDIHEKVMDNFLYDNADAVIIMGSDNDVKSLENINNWLKKVWSVKRLPILFVINKMDTNTLDDEYCHYISTKNKNGIEKLLNSLSSCLTRI